MALRHFLEMDSVHNGVMKIMEWGVAYGRGAIAGTGLQIMFGVQLRAS